MSGFRCFEVVSRWFQVVSADSGDFSWFQVVPYFSKYALELIKNMVNEEGVICF